MQLLSVPSLEEVKLINFSQHGDSRGHLVAIEAKRDIPFDIKRVFYIYGSENDVIRGQHANKKSNFVLINVSGSCKVKVIDSDGNSRIFELDKPNVGLYIPTMIWKDMYDFSKDCVMLAITDELYCPEEYVRNINDFLSKK